MRKKADDGGVYVEIRAFARPGYEGGSKEVEITDHNTVRLTSGKAKLYLDTIGEGESARFARTGGVKLQATPEAPIEIGIRSQSVAGKARVAERIWVDLVPCVLLSADEHRQKEAKLKADVDLAIDVNGRLEKRQSCLFGVKVVNEPGSEERLEELRGAIALHAGADEEIREAGQMVERGQVREREQREGIQGIARIGCAVRLRRQGFRLLPRPQQCLPAAR